jgi:hypothetical protein
MATGSITRKYGNTTYYFVTQEFEGNTNIYQKIPKSEATRIEGNTYQETINGQIENIEGTTYTDTLSGKDYAFIGFYDTNGIYQSTALSLTESQYGTVSNSINNDSNLKKLVVGPPNTSNPNQPGTPGTSTPTQGTNQNIDIKRTEFEVLRYPSDMSSTQDRIEFSVWELIKASTGDNLQFLPPDENSSYRSVGERVILPIQPSISDQNGVNWGAGELNEFQRLLGNFSLNAMNAKSLGQVPSEFKALFDEVVGDPRFGNFAKLSLTEQALGIQGLLSRATGQVLNPNLELLFQGPTLRPFQFQFKLSPRNSKEAEQVKAIIKVFKKNMAVRKTGGADLFLKAPYVFQIKYLKGSQEHQSINKIKKCALKSCSVDYTPLGTYMTYNDDAGTMVSYNLSLDFQEITPIYDTDYVNHPIGY